MSKDLDGKAPLIFFLPFAITFLDSAFAYFARPLGMILTANAVIPLVLLYFLFFERDHATLPRPTLVWLMVLMVCFCIAIVTATSIGPYRVLEAGSCAAAFYSGYLLWRRASDQNQLARWMVAFSLVYVGICLVALLGLDPAHFPVHNDYWAQDGIAQARPRVTTDSNMQFYYLFPAALALALPFRPIRTSLAAVAVTGSLYVLAQLQTRSGTLAYAAIICLALSASIWNRSLGRAKLLVYPLAGLACASAFWPKIQGAAELLLYRFRQDDLMSANGRVDSTLYGLHNVVDPYWWIPRGAEEFLQHHGVLPHSNLTALLLDGGLPGLIAWGALVIVPIVQTSALLLRRQLDAACIMALIAASGALVVQLSLHNPVYDQIWLWAGALTGALTRIRMQTGRGDAPRHQDVAGHRIFVDAAGIINSPQTSRLGR